MIKEKKIVRMYERDVKRIDTQTNKRTKKQELKKSDKQSHHAKNYLIVFGNKQSEIKKAVVNACDQKNAMRIALNKLCRTFPDIDISRMRVGEIYDNRTKKITINK